MNRTILTFFFWIATSALVSQPQTDPGQPLPLDGKVRYGQLDNGLTYYIRANQEPRERASFYIIQNVGALLEEDHQDGLAHFLEHMAFNGTKHFPEKGIIHFLERHGVAFGENINAYTSQNQTVYNLSDVPVNKPGILDTCLLILHDWSHYLLLTEEEIDLERGVIKEEWRTRRNAQWRMFTASLPYLYPNSKFAERDVIGSLDVIENFEYDALRDFYHKWYRTDLQAIAMVGDFDAEEMEQKVKELFSKIPPVQDPAERPFFEIPDHEAPVYGLVTDREADQTVIRYMIRHRDPDEGVRTVMDLREDYIQTLFNNMMSQRIDELLQKGDPPFVVGVINYGEFERGYEALSVIAIPRPNEEEKGFRALLTELERVKRHGFTPGELERAKSNILTRWEKYYKERDKISNDEYVDEYVSHFLEGDAFVSVEDEFQLIQLLLPTITTADFDARLTRWIGDKNRVLVVQGPEGEDVEHLTEEASSRIIEEVALADVEPYADEALAESLISGDLVPVGVLETKELPVFNAVEWTLENGARVIFRHADYEKDQVQLHAYSEGGTSLYGDEYVPSADMLTSLVNFYGLGEFDAMGLQKMLTGKNVSVQLSLNSLNEGMDGTASPGDMETLMQLVYLYFTHPRFDQEAHQAIMARYGALVRNMGNNPQKVMGDSLSLILSDYHPRTRVLNEEFLEDVRLDMIEEVYRDRFADAGDFIFIIVGNMDREEAKVLSQKYIGAIPDEDREETWIDRKIYEPEGVVKKEIPMLLETPKANVNIVLHNEMAYDPYHLMVMRVIEGILDLRYVESIREEEGGTYGVSIRTSLGRWPVEKARMQIRFDCDPGRASSLKEKVYDELITLAEEGPRGEDLSKTVENLLKTREQNKEHNAYYLNTISDYYIHGINFDDPANYEEILRTLTPADVQGVMADFYRDPNVVDVVFVPKEAATP
ncbi:MAG TPA: insulinase family protein [Bacteroides sp.]|nr:insulinase family protein [Bacteroides sp.]